MVLPAGVKQLGTFKGAKGDKGDPGTIVSVDAVTIPYGEDADVVMSGAQTARKATFFVPEGKPGVNGVENDTAVAAYVDSRTSETSAAVVRAITAPANVVFEGDSLTFGVFGTGVAWPNYPQTVASGLVGGSRTANVSAGGQTIETMLTQASSQVDARFDSAFLHNVAVLLGGINDLYQLMTPAKIYDDMVNWHQGRRAAGFKTVAVTVLPATGNNPPEGTEANRLALNTMIRDGWQTFADGLADAAADPVFTAAGVTLDKELYHTDRVHLSVRGYAELARIVRNGLATVGVMGGGSLPAQVGEGSLFRAASKPSGNVLAGYRQRVPSTDDTITVAVGNRALDYVSTGTANTAVGTETMVVVTTGANNTAVGAFAGRSTTGSGSTFVGAAAGYTATTGDHVAIGHRAMYLNANGITNTVVGSEAVYAGSTVSETTAIGRQALRNVTVNYNVAVGHRAGYAPAGTIALATTTGTFNTFIGYESGSFGATLPRGTAVGYQAQVGNSGTAVGYLAKASHVGSVAIGSNATTTADNQVMVGSRDIEITNATRGVILVAPNGTRYRVQVTDTGAVQATAA